MNRTDKPRPAKGSQLGSKAAGASIGTALVGAANALPEDSALKRPLLLVAPTLSVALDAAVSWGFSWLKHWHTSRNLKKAVSEAMARINDSLHNQDTSEDHKKEVRKDLEQLERLDINTKMERVQTLINNQ
ncbi:MAG TPA: hypothetical protein VMP11_12265 [Verrucomicrobiae bacterium]|nr:hypothetical protein [Verrucomicrobiae bacterium]